jgi:hypothetical protein
MPKGTPGRVLSSSWRTLPREATIETDHLDRRGENVFVVPDLAAIGMADRQPIATRVAGDRWTPPRSGESIAPVDGLADQVTPGTNTDPSPR